MSFSNGAEPQFAELHHLAQNGDAKVPEIGFDRPDAWGAAHQGLRS